LTDKTFTGIIVVNVMFWIPSGVEPHYSDQDFNLPQYYLERKECRRKNP